MIPARHLRWRCVMAVMIALGLGGSAAGEPGGLIPLPVKFKLRKGTFVLRPDTAVIADPLARSEADKLAAALGQATGFLLSVVEGTPVKLRRVLGLCRSGARDTAVCRPWIHLRLTRGSRRRGDEAYVLAIRPGGIRIRARAATGLFYAAHTLRQLLPPEIYSPVPVTGVTWAMPAARIQDHPRFSWRGMHLDVARHFVPTAQVKRLLDAMALHKLNRFHWHLTDDQGWRVEILAHPELTAIGAWRAESPVRRLSEAGVINLFLPSGADGVAHGGFYTQDEIRDVVAYAAERHITVIPEIDLPGHIQSAIASLPQLGNTPGPIEVATTYGIHSHILNVEESTFRFLEDVFGELLGLFPGGFIHLGGDEVLFDEWESSPAAQARIAELGLADESELLAWTINRVAMFLSDRGRRPVGWENGLYAGDLLAGHLVLTEWLSQAAGLDAAGRGRDVVMAPFAATYFDHPWLPLEPTQQAELEAALGANNPIFTSLSTDLAETYAFDPLGESPTREQEEHILGAQGQVWTEFILDGPEAERFAFPRLTALAEAVWTPRARKNFTDFESRLGIHLQRLDQLGVQHLRR